MSDYSNYDEVVQKILDSRPAVEEEYKKAGNAATTLCDINGTFVQIPGAAVVRDNGGNVIGYDFRYTGPNSPNTDIINVDSNTDSGLYGGVDAVTGADFRASEFSGGIQTDPTSTDKMTSGGQVSGFLSPAWALVSTLAKFGKTAANTAADFIEATADAFAYTFHDVLTRAGDAGASAVRALFGVESDGTTSMYIDEDTIGAAAIALRDAGAFDEGDGGTIDYSEMTNLLAPDRHTSPLKLYRSGDVFPWEYISGANTYRYEYTILTPNCFIIPYRTENGTSISFIISFYTSPGSTFAYRQVLYKNDTVITDRTSTENIVSNVNPIDGHSYYRQRTFFNFTIEGSIVLPEYNQVTGSGNMTNVSYDFEYIAWNGTYVPVESVPGITDQTGATSMVDAVTGADPHVVGQNLASQYPSVMGTPLQIVVMDDSCNQVTKNYYKVPISYSPTNVTANIPITGGTQISPSFNPNTSIDLPDINLDNYIEQIINQLGGSGAGRDVTTTDDDGNPETLPTDIPNTGTGVTPPEVLPETNVNAMWHVYNPSSAELSALGSWLWSSSIIDQITRLFNNPMESIIGVHAVYGEPSVTSATAIVVGNLTSTVSARVVSAQYTTVDCGSVWLTEHFGSAFDYDPYTKVSLFLPFIGIVRLNTADVMRAELHVLYNIDVYSGACVAMVEVKRDGVGGVLYQFSGSCAVSYPVSGAAYNNIFSGMLSLSLGIAAVASAATGAGAALSARAGAGIATGAILGASKMGVADVSRSGSFSGNAGAMGIKKPYLIITRPQTNMAINYEKYDGRGSNYTSRVADCRGYIKCKEVHLSVPGAYKEELDEIERLLKEGVRLPD